MKKIISLLICMAMLISMSVIPASAETYGKAWEFEGTTVESWQAQNSTLSVSDGSLVQTITTEKSNTFLQSPNNLGINASVYKYLKLRVKNSTAANGFFRFEAVNDTKTAFAGSWTTINGNTNPADGEWHEYCIDLSQLGTDWSGTVSRLRLCMSTWNTEGTIEYDYIRLSDTGDISGCSVTIDSLTNPTDIFLGETVDLTASVTGSASKVEYFANGTSIGSVTEAPYALSYTPTALGEYQVSAKATFAEGVVDSGNTYVYVSDRNVVENNAYTWNFNGTLEGWFVSKGETTSKGGCYVNTIAANDANSFLQSPSGLTIDASKYKYVKVRVAADYSLAGQLSLLWITEEDPAWGTTWSSGEKTCFLGTTAVINDGDFHDYVFDLSNSAGWTGTVTRLRIKVTPWSDTKEMTAKIDYIRVSDTLAYGIDSSLVPVEIPEVDVEEIGRYTDAGSNPAIAYTGTFDLNSVAVSGVKWTVADQSADVELGEAMSGEGTVVVGLVIELENTAIEDYTAVPTAECIAAQ